MNYDTAAISSLARQLATALDAQPRHNDDGPGAEAADLRAVAQLLRAVQVGYGARIPNLIEALARPVADLEKRAEAFEDADHCKCKGHAHRDADRYCTVVLGTGEDCPCGEWPSEEWQNRGDVTALADEFTDAARRRRTS